MSKETTQPPTDETAVPNTEPVLRREAVYVVPDQRKLFAFSVVSALAGVVVGFALSMLAQTGGGHCATGPEVHLEDQAPRAWLGVHIKTHPGTLGASVIQVVPGTPAETSGLKKGDLIVALDGKKLKTFEDLVAAVLSHKVGETVDVTFRRGHCRSRQRSHTVKATLASRP